MTCWIYNYKSIYKGDFKIIIAIFYNNHNNYERRIWLIQSMMEYEFECKENIFLFNIPTCKDLTLNKNFYESKYLHWVVHFRILTNSGSTFKFQIGLFLIKLDFFFLAISCFTLKFSFSKLHRIYFLMEFRSWWHSLIPFPESKARGRSSDSRSLRWLTGIS